MTATGGTPGSIPGSLPGWLALRQAVVRAVPAPTTPVVTGAGRLYAVRLAPVVAGTAVACLLRDGVDATGPIVAALATTAGGVPDDWPRVPISVGFQHGLFPVFGTGDAVLLVFWERA